ncbi:MAG: hypothetical protein VKK59_02450 [Vampirovibrionales bacterium]|nr:hypothetical protein [Vampirovibrionales bacterium]
MTHAQPDTHTTSALNCPSDKPLETTARFISGVDTSGQSLAGQPIAVHTWRPSVVTRAVRRTEYSLKGQQQLAQTVQEDLSAVQSFLSNCQLLSPLQALQFALVRVTR